MVRAMLLKGFKGMHRILVSAFASLTFVSTSTAQSARTSASPSPASCYKTDLAQLNHVWFIEFAFGEAAYLKRDETGRLSSRGPWFVDTNHQEAGEIVILAAVKNEANC